MPMEQIDTLIIGGGQAGLAMSDMLSRRGIAHLVIEQNRIAERWRSERWTGLRFQFPNWSIALPDFPFKHDDPDGFATSGEIVDYLASYAAHVKAPVRCGIKVRALRQSANASDYLAETTEGTIRARNVVVATGPYQRPATPNLLAGNGAVFQVHASEYKDPDQLPTGGVLIVGSGASGTQIAEELHRAGRRVYLSVGKHRRMPRRYRGHDLIWWLVELGIDKTPVEKRGPDKTLPLITGAYGGHTIDFRELANQGITLLGHVVSGHDETIELAPGLCASLEAGDVSYFEFLDKVDCHVWSSGLDVPLEPEARVMLPDPASVRNPPRHLDLQQEGINSVIWATGYAFDFSWIEMSVCDCAGEPEHCGGVANVPGLYFIGLPWLTRMNSSFLSGVGDDAARIAAHIAARMSPSNRASASYARGGF